MTTARPRGRAALSSAARPSEIAQRVFLAVIGGYFFISEFAGFCGLLLTHALPRSEAAGLSAMLAFIFYTVAILWAFADYKLARVWAGILGGTALFYALNVTVVAGNL